MKRLKLIRLPVILIVLFLAKELKAQEEGIKTLDFLIGTWETREDIEAEGWWETATREINYALKDNYIEVRAQSKDSNGREREYLWYINYNKKEAQFQMVSMFSNWYKTQFDILEWNEENRTLTIRNKPGLEKEYHERYGQFTFNEDFTEYTWKGENKYGDANNPSIWRYVEKGRRID